MRVAQNRNAVRVRSAIGLSGAGAVIGWSAGTGSMLGIGAGLAVATVALATTVGRQRAATDLDQPEGSAGDGGWQEVQRELDRARRHQRPFVLIRTPSPSVVAAGNGHARGVEHPGSLWRSLRPFLRSADSMWTADGHLYLLLPESTRAMGEAFLSRVRQAEPHLLPETDLVAFPEDGVTAGALVALLHGQRLDRHTLRFSPEAESVHQAS